MRVCVSLFGAFRQYQSEDDIELDVIEGARIADLRHTPEACGQELWPAFLLEVCDEREPILR